MEETYKGNNALIIQGGGLRGAYAVGVLKKLYNYLPPNRLQAIYAVSSGVFAATYYLATQVDEMEATWRNRVSGRDLIDYLNVLKCKPILKLDDLIRLFQNDVYLDLDILEERLNNSIELRYVVTEYDNATPKYLKPNRENIFEMMRAASALPCMYSEKVILNSKRYFDGGQSDPLPIKRVLEDGYNNIFIIMTRPENSNESLFSKVAKMLCLFYRYGNLDKYRVLRRNYMEAIDLIYNPPQGVNIEYISPSKLYITGFSRNRRQIIQTIEQGKMEFEKIIGKLRFLDRCLVGSS